MPRANKTLLKDNSGAALVEFAMIAPVLVFTLLGVFEIGYNFYIQSQLQGTVQKTARSSTIESASGKEAAIDARVKTAVHLIAPKATVTYNRKAYATFSKVSQPEDFKDLDGDDVCNNGEQFEDANGNGQWDTDRGMQGFGGARDVVLYTVTITYPRAFGMATLLGFGDTVDFEATTVLRNQPYDTQVINSVLQNCL